MGSSLDGERKDLSARKREGEEEDGARQGDTVMRRAVRGFGSSHLPSEVGQVFWDLWTPYGHLMLSQ